MKKLSYSLGVTLTLCILLFAGIFNGAAASETPVFEQGTNPSVLIAYFTWAENTHVKDPGAVDVDAVTSASVLNPGNTARVAQHIQKHTGADVFRILTTEPYSDDYDSCLDRAIIEHDDNARPSLTAQVESMDTYDIVFLGFPNWWYSCPMAILTFLESYDFSGKTIVPFCAHGTGGFAASLRDIAALLPEDCVITEAYGVYRPDVFTCGPEVQAWIDSLNLGF